MTVHASKLEAGFKFDIWLVTTNHGTSLSMDCKYEPSPPIKVCLTSPPSPREKESTAQATPKRRWLRQVWEKSKFVTGSSSKLAKQPNIHKTVAHIINPGEITRFVHAIDLAWQTYNSAPACMILMVTMGWPSEFTELAISQTCDC
jgi:hypothetical protein